jgi:small subunit ribosomal protein S1
VHISELAERHVEVPDQVVGVGDDALVKVIDIDLERRRISLSLKQANEDYAEEFDPSKYGMADSYDEGGNYIFPEGFDSETNEWLEGYEKQREEWEGRYAEAERRHKMHTAQMEKTAKDEAAEAANTNYSSESGQAPADAEGDAPAASAPASTGGSLASDAQLAALREKLSGNA